MRSGAWGWFWPRLLLGEPLAETISGAVSLVLAVVLLGPVTLCVRRMKSEGRVATGPVSVAPKMSRGLLRLGHLTLALRNSTVRDQALAASSGE